MKKITKFQVRIFLCYFIILEKGNIPEISKEDYVNLMEYSRGKSQSIDLCRSILLVLIMTFLMDLWHTFSLYTQEFGYPWERKL